MKLYLIVGVVITACVFGGLWLNDRDNRIKNEAIASERIREDSLKIEDLRDSLDLQRVRVDTADSTVTRFTVEYDTLRNKITLTDTSRFVLVDTQYVHVSDSVRDSCASLVVTCSEFRKTADSIMITQERVIANLRVSLAAVRSSKVKTALTHTIAAGVGFGACKLAN